MQTWLKAISKIFSTASYCAGYRAPNVSAGYKNRHSACPPKPYAKEGAKSKGLSWELSLYLAPRSALSEVEGFILGVVFIFSPQVYPGGSHFIGQPPWVAVTSVLFSRRRHGDTRPTT